MMKIYKSYKEIRGLQVSKNYKTLLSDSDISTRLNIISNNIIERVNDRIFVLQLGSLTSTLPPKLFIVVTGNMLRIDVKQSRFFYFISLVIDALFIMFFSIVFVQDCLSSFQNVNYEFYVTLFTVYLGGFLTLRLILDYEAKKALVRVCRELNLVKSK